MAYNQLELTAKKRVLLMKTLVEQCSHEEQLEILAILTQCLKRDFVSSLPLEIVEHILLYIDPVYIIRVCMLVSRSVNEEVFGLVLFLSDCHRACGAGCHVACGIATHFNTCLYLIGTNRSSRIFACFSVTTVQCRLIRSYTCLLCVHRSATRGTHPLSHVTNTGEKWPF